MKPSSAPTNRQDLFLPRLEDMLNPHHHLCRLASAIQWVELETPLLKLYSEAGRPAKPIRLMVSLLILKQLHNLSDEETVAEWQENAYWQYFSGEETFQVRPPCDPSEMTYFRRRIGESGIETILKASITIHGAAAREAEVIADTTVQEKNITFPTDSKLAIKVIETTRRIAKQEGVELRQSYVRVLKRERWKLRYHQHPKRAKEARGAARKIKTIAGRLHREVQRKLSQEAAERHRAMLDRCEKVLKQKKTDKNKIYSLHEPHVACHAKGKDRVRYEFGSKVALLTTKTSGIITGVKNFSQNLYDGKTLKPLLEQSEKLLGKRPEKVIVDEGYRGATHCGTTAIIRPHQLRAKPETAQKQGVSKRRARHWFNRRASIEPRIGHLKTDFRLNRNFLKGIEGDAINAMMAAAASNFRIFIREMLSFLFLRFAF
jgi:IS5 family transposase